MKCRLCLLSRMGSQGACLPERFGAWRGLRQRALPSGLPLLAGAASYADRGRWGVTPAGAPPPPRGGDAAPGLLRCGGTGALVRLILLLPCRPARQNDSGPTIFMRCFMFREKRGFHLSVDCGILFQYALEGGLSTDECRAASGGERPALSGTAAEGEMQPWQTNIHGPSTVIRNGV